MAADDVAAALGRATVGQPIDGVQEVGGPEKHRMDELVGTALQRAGDDREVVADEQATYFGDPAGRREPGAGTRRDACRDDVRRLG